MTDVRIRRARDQDAAAIARVHVETWRTTYAGLVPDRYLVGMSVSGQTFQWSKAIQRRGRGEVILVAELRDGGPLVGFGSGGWSRPAGPPFDGEVYTLYVAGDWQGRGVGRRLLAGLFGGLARAGAASAFLWVLASNPSRFFYEALGGQRVAERQEPFAGVLLDEAAYAWPDLRDWLAHQDSLSRDP